MKNNKFNIRFIFMFSYRFDESFGQIHRKIAIQTLCIFSNGPMHRDCQPMQKRQTIFNNFDYDRPEFKYYYKCWISINICIHNSSVVQTPIIATVLRIFEFQLCDLIDNKRE